MGIFAHPDDESFGPSGTLYKAAQTGTDVHLLLITDGSAGQNTADVSDLGSLRVEEWRQSAKLIGATSTYSFGYKDGELNNNKYVEVAEKIFNEIRAIVATYNKPIMLDFMTFDQSGITGHIDHIMISNITTFIYEKLRQNPPSQIIFGKLRYFCVCKDFSPKPNTEWIYMPAGHEEADFDEIVDIADVYEKKLEIMLAHKSQKSDMDYILNRYGNKPCGKHECFMYYKG